MAPHLAKLDAAIEPGLTMLNWTSLNLTTYLDSVYEALRELDLLLSRAQDLVSFRIDGVLEEMSLVPLCELPSDASWTVEEFLKKTEVSLVIWVVLKRGNGLHFLALYKRNFSITTVFLQSNTRKYFLKLSLIFFNS